MNMDFIRKLPVPAEIKEQFPISEELKQLKKKRDEEIARVFTGESDKFILVIGPCSADHEDSVLDYTNRLAGLQEKVKDKIIIIPRIYTNK
ncbi:MAG: 3-deoxy-7-phosphoheptulonate synthase, partial [Clostridia bacterium]